MHVQRVISISSTLFAGLVALVLPALARGAAFPITAPKLSAPRQVSPLNTWYPYDVVTPTVAIVWDQYPAIASTTQALPNNYILCLLLPDDMPCSHETAVWKGTPQQVPSVPIRPSLLAPPIGNHFTLVPTLLPRNLDVGQTWVIGACTSMSDASCSFSTAFR